MRDLVPLLIPVAVGVIAYSYSQTKFIESRFSRWMGDVATLIIMGWFGVLIVNGSLSSVVERGAVLVFFCASAYGFWQRFSGQNRDKSDYRSSE